MTPFSRAARSSGGYASGSRISATSGCRKSALSSTVNFESSAFTSPAGRDDQRVDLAEHRVEVDERLVEPADDRGDLLLLVGVVDAGAVDQPPRVPRLEALERVDVQPDERVRRRRRDLLDVDPALRREHEQRLLRAAVERDREVVLLRDVRRLLDPEPADDVAADVEAEDLRARAPPPRRASSASLIPPALPRPPVSTCALTTTGPPSSSAAARASAGVVASRPSDTGIPARRKSSLPWYS